VPRQDLDRALLEKNSEVRQRLESQQEELTAAFTRKLEDTKSHYQSRITYLENQLNSRNGTHISQAKTALLRREYGEEVDDKREQLNKALGQVSNLEEQLAAKTQEITALRQQTDSLQEKAASDEAQIRKQNDIIASLKSQLETTPREDAKMRALEQENALLKRDYDALASLHKRTLQERRKPETPGSGRSSPLRRRPEELEEASSLRQYYERRCTELRDEAMQWKEKVKALTLRHHHALQDLQQDKRELQQEIAALGEEMRQQVRAVELELHRQNGFTPRGASLQARRGEIRH
jgi:chromosome segregation ATPase